MTETENETPTTHYNSKEEGFECPGCKFFTKGPHVERHLCSNCELQFEVVPTHHSY